MSTRRKIRKILVANRGEIARRLVLGAKEAGLETVAIHSEADAGAPHVRLADEAVPIGPPPVRESYLQIERIVRAAIDRRCDAVHPGYGLLSENAEFAAACESAGLVFVGPRAETIALMGRKAAARERMRQVGVPILPGSPELRETAEAERAADAIGYPVILKATAGGGGIGMQVARDAAELRKLFPQVKSRAAAVFRDDAIYLERYLERPRHVEVQVLGDGRGGVVHLFERECSIQRRHQKIVEESPAPAFSGSAAAPGVGSAARERLLAAAVAGAAHVGYRNAGTLEFLLDPPTGEFFFMEMNTRLQVEHPVTEMTTGRDLVRAQLAIAAEPELPFAQAEIAQRGHAVEARVYAEDPAKGFAPSPGRLGAVVWPEGEGVRCDFGYESGAAVTPYYDPLLAKVVAHGAGREEAIARLRGALERTSVEGVRTNLALLRRIAADERFARGEFDTSYLAGRKDLTA
jgi:acetyl-CoA carboxylase biotin carboxylase subunit